MPVIDRSLVIYATVRELIVIAAGIGATLLVVGIAIGILMG